MFIKKKFISLHTYKRKSPLIRSVLGSSKKVQIEREWLEEQIKPQSLDSFMDEYTFDDSCYLHEQYVKKRERLLDRNRNIVSHPAANLEKMSIRELRVRAEVLESSFKDMFGEAPIKNNNHN
ncbi:hypothetical protein H0266_18360 [Halobacillus locisalis]|uniref:Uncharacterized protein n=1 Tax=Halobacillus locisalis TaxID=220753 RepID=A0A838CZV8_9BACI|nr:hypothetical protein [Halobacillus locisalis]MBA2176846.1 hypothetical protein [Halobacillus locisalis]